MIGLVALVQVAAGVVEGRVIDESDRPIRGAVVSIGPEGTRVIADSVGRFEATVRAGRWRLVVEAFQHHPVSLEVDVPARRRLRLDIALTAMTPAPDERSLTVEVRGGEGLVDLATVEVDGARRTAVAGVATFRAVGSGARRIAARRFGYQSRDTVVVLSGSPSTVVLRLEALPVDLSPLVVLEQRSRSTASPSGLTDFASLVTTGMVRRTRAELAAVPPAFERDVLRSVQATPGVAAANDLNAHPAIRGGAPEDTRYTLDGVPVLAPYHMFGLFGAFNPDAVDEAQVLRGALPARLGGTLGSVVSLVTRRPDRVRVASGLTAAAGRLTAAGPLGPGHWLVGVRRTVLPQNEDGQGLTWFRYWDLQGGATVPTGANHRLQLTAFASGDRFNEDLSFVDARSPLESEWSNRLGGARWTWTPAGWSVEAAASTTRYQWTVAGRDATRSLPTDPAHGLARVSSASVAASRTTRWGTLRIGAEVAGERTRLDDDSLGLGYFTGVVDRRATDAAVWSEADWRLGRLVLAGGLRVTRRTTNDRLAVEPRVVGTWRASSRVALSAAVAETRQSFQALRDERYPLLGVPLLFLPEPTQPLTRARMAELVAEVDFGSGWRLEAAWYRRWLGNRPLWRPEGARTVDQVRYTSGTAGGFELSATGTAGPIRGWVGYALAGASARDADGRATRPLWHRRHSLDAVGRFSLTSWAELTSRVIWATGQPFWVEQGSLSGYDFAIGTGQLGSAPRRFPLWSNEQATLPSYLRADVVVSMRWRVGRLVLGPYLGAFNIGNRHNVAGYRWAGGSQRFLPREQIPRLPVFGLDVSLEGGPR